MTSLKTTARTTGLLYLGVGVTGMLGFLLIRREIYVAGDAAATYANLVEREMLARLGIAFELLVVLTQALAAVWFYKLFRTVSSTARAHLPRSGHEQRRHPEQRRLPGDCTTVALIQRSLR